MYLLSDAGDSGILPDLLRCLRMDGGDQGRISSNDLWEHCWIPFAKLDHDPLGEAWQFVSDAAIDSYTRTAVVSGVIAMHHFHPERRAAALEFMRRLLRHPDAFPEDRLASMLCDCAESGLHELQGDALTFVRAMKPDHKRWIAATGDDVRRAFQNGPREDFISRRAQDAEGVNRVRRSRLRSFRGLQGKTIAPEWVYENAEFLAEVVSVARIHNDEDTTPDAEDSLFNELELANRLLALVATRERWEEIDRSGMADLPEWLLHLPFALAAGGFVTEAAEMGRAWSEIFESANFLGDRAVLLAEGGFRAESRDQIAEAIQRFPEDVWVRIKSGDACRTLGELAEAESCYRFALTLSEESYDRLGALERLVPMLADLGKTAEADILEAEEKARRRQQRAPSPRPAEAVVTAVAPRAQKVGRNEACPCGSGKKFKKCHGG